jgi:hypothetical protein
MAVDVFCEFRHKEQILDADLGETSGRVVVEDCTAAILLVERVNDGCVDRALEAEVVLPRLPLTDEGRNDIGRCR